MPKEKEPPPNIGNAIPLGRDWVAIVLEDDRVLLQCRSSIGLPDGYVVDLNDPFGLSRAQRYPEELDVRSLMLYRDGTVFCDPHGISQNGVLSDRRSYPILAPVVDAIQGAKVERRGNNNMLPDNED